MPLAGYVVLHPEFHKDSSGSILAEICEWIAPTSSQPPVS